MRSLDAWVGCAVLAYLALQTVLRLVAALVRLLARLAVHVHYHYVWVTAECAANRARLARPAAPPEPAAAAQRLGLHSARRTGPSAAHLAPLPAEDPLASEFEIARGE